MKTIFKIIILSSSIFCSGLQASSEASKSIGPSSPVTPLSPMRKLSSSFRLTPKQTWQEEISGNVPSGFVCTSNAENKMQISGKFSIDERTWEVLENSSKEKNWQVAIEIEKSSTGNYFLMVTNPSQRYISMTSNFKPNETWFCKTQHVSERISSLLKILDPRSPIYGE